MNADQVTLILFAVFVFIVVLILVYGQWSDDKKYEAEKQAEAEEKNAQKANFEPRPLLALPE